MWTKMNFPPQPFGECSLCKRHSCGEHEEDGKKVQTWLHFPIELDRGGNLVIGYQCINTMSKDAGIGLKVVETVLQLPPTDEQVLKVFRAEWDSLNQQPAAIVAPEEKPKQRRGANK